MIMNCVSADYADFRRLKPSLFALRAALWSVIRSAAGSIQFTCVNLPYNLCNLRINKS
jgi:hypothetical protein